jgi:hypothetical protein
MNRNSLSGGQCQNTYRYSISALPSELISVNEISNQQALSYITLSPEKYHHLRERIKYHESQLGTIECRILDCILKLKTNLEVSQQEISSKLSNIQKVWDSIMNEVDNKLNSIMEVFAPQHEKLYDLIQTSRDYLQTHQENPDRFTIDDRQASAVLKLTDLPSFDTELMFTLEQDKVKLMKSKLDDLLTEIEKCKKTMKISANTDSEDKYVVVIEDRKLIFETKEGYITSFVEETKLLASQELIQPEEKEEESKLLDISIEKSIKAFNQAEDKEDENQYTGIPIEQYMEELNLAEATEDETICLYIPIDQNATGILQHESSASQPHESMQESKQEEHNRVSEDRSARISSNEDYKSSSNNKPNSAKTKRRQRKSRNISNEEFIVSDSDSDLANPHEEWTLGPKSNAEESQVLKRYQERKRRRPSEIEDNKASNKCFLTSK